MEQWSGLIVAKATVEDGLTAFVTEAANQSQFKLSDVLPTGLYSAPTQPE